MKKSMATVWTVLLIVLVLLVLAGGGYHYLNSKQMREKGELNKQIEELKAQIETLKASEESSSERDESSFKTYTNKTYGYSFRYPADFYLIDYLYDGQNNRKIEYGKIVVVDKKNIPENALKSESEIPAPYFGVTVQSDYQFGLSELSSGLEEVGGNLSNTTVDGEQAWKIHYSEPSVMDESYSTAIYVNHGGSGYIISWENSNASGTHDTEIDDIVASLRWL